MVRIQGLERARAANWRGSIKKGDEDSAKKRLFFASTNSPGAAHEDRRFRRWPAAGSERRRLDVAEWLLGDCAQVEAGRLAR